MWRMKKRYDDEEEGGGGGGARLGGVRRVESAEEIWRDAVAAAAQFFESNHEGASRAKNNIIKLSPRDLFVCVEEKPSGASLQRGERAPGQRSKREPTRMLSQRCCRSICARRSGDTKVAVHSTLCLFDGVR